MPSVILLRQFQNEAINIEIWRSGVRHLWGNIESEEGAVEWWGVIIEWAVYIYTYSEHWRSNIGAWCTRLRHTAPHTHRCLSPLYVVMREKERRRERERERERTHSLILSLYLQDSVTCPGHVMDTSVTHLKHVIMVTVYTRLRHMSATCSGHVRCTSKTR